ncbi:hypothetical protein TVAG_322990 [Trichomonas vaginalis G3]|uniref:Uncharacterized protein n=1 Tax=Trichomonas vaginalis (strain ATCC PRA-98 / G3) TaxID=412133 RepID=A2G1A5_TRIV3|nr:hypothetical protein TVAGG3_0433380 [Trichomonas vaginalis G3]EAX89063.1 hypothetical protein TVAG_322990 [Trichomonas vaginalis G3]KAI5536916.1 hypothetical protein TVAGG3_0433380 [Trichomonas vaginalis G3]|eukprot:XP_001301993.1 hypothetical protein [Trichomonas vaginalis G3]
MSEEELRQQIDNVKESIEKIKRESKENERELVEQTQILEDEKKELIEGIKARMQLIDMLKRDIYRVAYEQSLKVTDIEHSKPTTA